MKTGILGGTFDPIHLGHLILAEEAYDAAGLDRVLLVPTGCSYFKEDQKVTDAKTRYEMTLLAAEGTEHLQVSDIETNRPGNSYTAVTLRKLREQYPEDELCCIVGADTLVMMSLWKDPETIFSLATILVSARKDEVSEKGLLEEKRALEEKYGAKIELLPVRNIEISSTQIRELVLKGRSIHFLVPEKVEQYIRDHGLYRG
ncbi:MAG: nicotinate-nucleotide adenylyltransferase [Lachnospiraceae bacterium]|nr:nicotinate-nucleotide adenylyltransferase [Lachnospiraceae bacterium]